MIKPGNIKAIIQEDGRVIADIDLDPTAVKEEKKILYTAQQSYYTPNRYKITVVVEKNFSEEEGHDDNNR